jgi:hypothetical protein
VHDVVYFIFHIILYVLLLGLFRKLVGTYCHWDKFLLGSFRKLEMGQSNSTYGGYV